MKKTLLTIMSAVTVITAAGCASKADVNQGNSSSQQATAASATTAAAKEVTLTFWSTNKDLYADDIKQFESKYPNIKIKAEFMGDYDEMAKKVMAGVVANSLPNVVQLGQRHGIPQIADSGKLIPIEQFMEKKDIDDIYPAFWNRFRYKEKLWTIPFNSSTPVMYYNKTMLEKAGVKPPDNWNELVEAAKKLTQDTNGDGKTDIWGFNTAADTPWYLQPMTWNRGGKIVDPVANKITVNSKESVETLKSFQDLVNVQKAMAPNQHKTAEEDFNSGKVAILFKSGSALAATQKQVGDKFAVGVAPLPMIQSRTTPIGGNSLGIFKSNDELQKASWTFVSYLTNTENAAKTSMKSGYVPIRKTSTDLPEFQKLLKENDGFKANMGQIEYLYGQAIHPADSLIWSGLVTALETVEGDSKADPQKLLDKLQQDVDVFMKSYK
ncbi:ABC transporter substrate-binding protein [Paenibacillus qinlingensis]|uniref:Sn-glycerol 3-phosphate transport system substrate-binding protein n=1 Tax=Paenibacillus qinlingensis TaxID=1837343 RepID=A0ABU1NVX7_9BACL|nr:ABC transporter substrate-binding protein [Paenibacillus qinlingensis]MDR6551623.1 sn-glycerol 3-phosphate transport system substrate-binding protein [Paenibacillus qinlingensis]